MMKKFLQTMGMSTVFIFMFVTTVLAIGPEDINWNKPANIVDRIMGQGPVEKIPSAYDDFGVKFAGKKGMLTGYQLPQGWKEATKGVKKLVLSNSGTMDWDPATVLNAKIFEEMTGIRLEFIECKDSILWPKALSVLMSKSTDVDIITSSNLAFEFPHLIAANWIYPIDILWPAEVKKLYPKELLSDISGPDGRVYGATVATWGMFLFYRPSWLKKAGVEVPETWQELVKATKKVDKWAKTNLGQGYDGMCYAGGSLDTLRQLWAMPTYAQGKRINVNNKIVIDPKTWKIITDLWLKGGMSKGSIEQTWSGSPEVFAKGKAGFTITGSVFMADFADPEFGSSIKGDWEVTLVPAWKGVGVRGRIQTEYDSWAINPFISPAQLAAAMLWMDFYRGYQAQFNELFVEGNESAVPAVYNHPLVKDQISYTDLRQKTLAQAAGENFPPGMNEVLSTFKEYLDKVVIGETSSKSGLKKAQEEIGSMF